MKCTPRPSYTTRPDRTNGAADRDPNDPKKRVTDDLRAAAPGTFLQTHTYVLHLLSGSARMRRGADLRRAAAGQKPGGAGHRPRRSDSRRRHGRPRTDGDRRNDPVGVRGAPRSGRRFDGRPFGTLRAAHRHRRRRRDALRARLPRPHAPPQIAGPRRAPLHGAGDDVLRHAGRGRVGRRLLVPLLLGADDRGVVPADPLRRRAARGAAGRALVPDHDAHRLPAPRRRFRAARRRDGLPPRSTP